MTSHKKAHRHTRRRSTSSASGPASRTRPSARCARLAGKCWTSGFSGAQPPSCFVRGGVRIADAAAMLRGVADFKFSNEVTVRFAETDAQGIAHHAAYLVWFETTRIEYLRRFRGGYLGLREEGVDALTLEATRVISRAAGFDDRLTIRARCSDVRGARFRFDYSVERDGSRSRTAGRRTRASRSATTGPRGYPPGWPRRSPRLRPRREVEAAPARRRRRGRRILLLRLLRRRWLGRRLGLRPVADDTRLEQYEEYHVWSYRSFPSEL